jgi:integrase/recombinase XerD
VYTHLALGRLKAVHRMHHPRATRRTAAMGEEAMGAGGEVDEVVAPPLEEAS